MPRKASPMALCLTDEDRSILCDLARSRTAPAHHVERSAIILHMAERRDTSEMAAMLRIERQRVTRCARRVSAVGPLKAIDDLPPSGRPPEISEAARAELIGEACVKADLGISQRTVENHRASIMRKTGSASVPALARLALAASWNGDEGPGPGVP